MNLVIIGYKCRRNGGAEHRVISRNVYSLTEFWQAWDDICDSYRGANAHFPESRYYAELRNADTDELWTTSR